MITRFKIKISFVFGFPGISPFRHLLSFLMGVMLMIIMPRQVLAWSEHPLLVRPALEGLPLWNSLPPAEVKSLETFLLESESKLAEFLKQHEAWSVQHLPNYKPCPADLTFVATGNPEDIRYRFLTAIRINPNARIPLYLHLLPHDEEHGRMRADPREISTLEDISTLLQSRYIKLSEGEWVHPLDILVSATDEPDYGFDLGLFSDNNTPYGRSYGFGIQPFGNPNLEYSSQAPFHMGFFHEKKLLYSFGPFLKENYIDYRIFLYKALAEFAFDNHQPYWGWRFLGWGMHYVGDVSMPYHMKPLPGVSAFRMIWINLKAMAGFSKARDNAVQLVSNRHTIFEDYQLQLTRNAHENRTADHPFLKALRQPSAEVVYDYDYLISKASLRTARSSKRVDATLAKCVPYRFVSDPNIEVNGHPEAPIISEIIPGEMGQSAELQLTEVIAERLVDFGADIRSYLLTILQSSVLAPN